MLGFALVAASALLAGAATACPVFDHASPTLPRSAITARDIAALRDFGHGDTSQMQGTAIGVSPDRTRIALLVRRPDLERNVFCQALVIISVAEPSNRIIIDVAAQPLFWAPDLRGLETPNGAILPNAPKWSPDGKTIAFRGTIGGKAQVSAVGINGENGRVLTNDPAGVDAFAWSPRGDELIIASRSGIAQFETSLNREALVGFHYDRRMSPMFSSRPMTPGKLAPTYQAVRLADGKRRNATTAERTLVDPTIAPGQAAGALAFVVNRSGRWAWTTAKQARAYSFDRKLWSDGPSGPVACSYASCAGMIFDVWWSGDAIIYLRREGWGDSITAIYSWRPGSRPLRILATGDALAGCTLAEVTLLCGREASLQPRRLWSLDVRSGAQRILLDPNPDFPGLAVPRVERLHFPGPYASQGYADLVIPAGPVPPGGFPLIVVGYRTRGFLRGAIGDEYPILAFAAHGFAVLSLEMARYYSELVKAPGGSREEAERSGTAGNHERQSQLLNLQNALRAVKERVPIDEERIGGTGVSDAASSATYALVNTNLLSVVSLGSPPLDASALVLGGHAIQEEFHDSGFPLSTSEDNRFYRSLSLTPNAGRIKAPLLLQYADTEYLYGLAAVTALEEHRAPVDLFVFPGEFHVKVQPAHRLAIYERNLDWFDFWLNRHEDKAADKRSQFARWRVLRDQLCVGEEVEHKSAQLCSQASTSTRSVTRM